MNVGKELMIMLQAYAKLVYQFQAYAASNFFHAK